MFPTRLTIVKIDVRWLSSPPLQFLTPCATWLEWPALVSQLRNLATNSISLWYESTSECLKDTLDSQGIAVPRKWCADATEGYRDCSPLPLYPLRTKALARHVMLAAARKNTRELILHNTGARRAPQRCGCPFTKRKQAASFGNDVNL